MLFELYRQIKSDEVTQVDPHLMAALDPGLRWLMERRWPACAAAAAGGAQ
ncbi:hypothetical protein ACFQ3Z_15865 [Streptomyces nogalater]